MVRERPPRLRLLMWLRSILLVAQPPLLPKKGVHSANSFTAVPGKTGGHRPPLQLFRRLLCGFGGSLLFRSSSGKAVTQTVIPFVAGVLKYRTDGLLPWHFCRPGSGPGRRILDAELITHRVVGHACEAFDQTHVLGGSLKGRFVREVRRFDHQGLALPVAAAASLPHADILWQLRTPVQGDDADAMKHLDENHHVSRDLHNLIGIVIGAGEHWRSVAVHEHTTHGEGLILCSI